MTHEKRAKLIKRTFFLILASSIGAGVYFLPAPKAKEETKKETNKLPKMDPADKRLVVVHHHLPGDPASEQIADILNHIQKKYDKYLVVNRVDFKQNPQLAKAQGVVKPPHVIVFSGSEKVYEFQGPATEVQVEQKIEEILRGLKRIDKNWRPPVPGMKPVGG